MGWRGVSGKLPIQYPGAICHVMNRGDQRGAVFRDDEDRLKLLVTLGEACRKTEWPAVGPLSQRGGQGKCQWSLFTLQLSPLLREDSRRNYCASSAFIGRVIRQVASVRTWAGFP
jgi:hypothetical protein